MRLVRNTRALGPSPVPENNLISGNFPFDGAAAAAACALDMVTGDCIRVIGEGVLGGGVGVLGLLVTTSSLVSGARVGCCVCACISCWMFGTLVLNSLDASSSLSSMCQAQPVGRSLSQVANCCGSWSLTRSARRGSYEYPLGR